MIHIPRVEAFRATPELSSPDSNLPERRHLFDSKSIDAVRASIAAGRPLLARGEPGTGKTQLAEATAAVLKRPLKRITVDSRTESRQLMWEFDAVMRLADAQVLAAFGRRKSEGSETDDKQRDDVSEARKLLREELGVAKYVRPGPLWWAFDWKGAADQAERCGEARPSEEETKRALENGCVVLIDEIDKGETDVPNGLLEALGSGTFTPFGCAEVKIQGPPPLVIITTNEERTLPAAFERRCFVLNLDPKNDDEYCDLLKKRAAVHFPNVENSSKLFEEAAKILLEDRNVAIKQGLKPRPGQAEYLDLLRAVLNLADGDGGKAEALLETVAAYAVAKHKHHGAVGS